MIKSPFFAVILFLALIPLQQPNCSGLLDQIMAEWGVTPLSPVDPMDQAAGEVDTTTRLRQLEAEEPGAIQRQSLDWIKGAIRVAPWDPRYRYYEAAWYLAQGNVDLFNDSLTAGRSLADANESRYRYSDDDRDLDNYVEALKRTRDAYPPSTEEYQRVHTQYCKEADKSDSDWDMTGCPKASPN